jgi:asparagine synthase (glutamine-hydrolysing)
MSGIAGLVPPAGAPVDEALLGRMGAFLAARATDGGGVRALGAAGLAHARMVTGDPFPEPPQPLSLDGRHWIVADARVDARADLLARLRAAGEDAPAGAPSAELILRAYRAWGDACVERLVGDYAFALWDAPERRLLCARSPFGLKPFFHAAAGGDFVFASSPECVRLHPGVPGGLDEGWVADFLVHGYPFDEDATVWRGVRALPPAHLLVLRDGRAVTRRFWELPRGGELRLRGPREYAERFVAVLRDAVRDRLPEGDAGFFLSGGRDSPTLAALAREVVARGERDTRLHALTAYCEWLYPDPEPPFARMAGEALGIPIHFHALDEYRAFERWEDPRLRRPQPVAEPLLALIDDELREMAARSRVLLMGLAGDAVLRESRSRLVRLVAGGHPLRALGEAAVYTWHHRRVPRPGVRTWLRGGAEWSPPAIPRWISPEFAGRVGLAERLRAQGAPPEPPHPLRPEAHAQLASPFWPYLFDSYGPWTTGVPLEARQPFADTRVVSLLLSIPPAQWYNDKGPIRIGMRGRLPEPILRRPKTPAGGDVLATRRQSHGPGWIGGRTAGSEIEPFVDPTRLSRAVGGVSAEEPGALWVDLRPLALSLWLRGEAG